MRDALSRHGPFSRAVVSLTLALVWVMTLPAWTPLVFADSYLVLLKPASPPPRIDGVIDPGEWQTGVGSTLAFPHGSITVTNDNIRLYVLVDVTGDTTSDPLWGPNPIGGDVVDLAFDVNGDSLVTQGVDRLYAFPYRGPPNLDLWTFDDKDHVDNSSATSPILSSWAPGFGCFLGDNTLQFDPSRLPPFSGCQPHRVYELAIDLSEIGAAATVGTFVRMGVQVASGSPDFVDNVPVGYTDPDQFLADNVFDFSNLIRVFLAPSAIGVADPQVDVQLRPSKPIEVTQAIQDVDNGVPLVANKDTAVRVYPTALGDFSTSSPVQPAVVYLYGRRGDAELPGSPLSQRFFTPPSYSRDSFGDSADFLLPSSWTTNGSVEFSARLRDLNGATSSDSGFTRPFTPRKTPTIWVVPINVGTAKAPTLPTQPTIDAAESYARTVYPVPSADFVQKPWEDIGALGPPPTVCFGTNTCLNFYSIIASLNRYYTNALTAWSTSFRSTGTIPFHLPDQIYGMTSQDFGSLGGLSNPIWNGGDGIAASGNANSETTMAHEMNHNLDRRGRWGRHAPGCGAPGTDPDWPYANGSIQETGFDTRLPWPNPLSQTVVPRSTPDFMTYCFAGSKPRRWISPYRWRNLFGVFPTFTTARATPSQHPVAPRAVAAPAVSDVLYVSGTITSDGAGSLDPIVVESGIRSTDILPGSYSIDLLDAQGTVLAAHPFFASFTGIEGGPAPIRYFNFQFQPAAGTETVRLRHGTQVLDAINVSAHAPAVTLDSPNGGESIGADRFTVRWHGSDADGDPLTFSLLYSPDDGDSWYPVASGLTGTSYQLSSRAVPGGPSSLIRVIATDGFNTAHDDSNGPFALSPAPPTVNILTPLDDTTVQRGQVVTFTGQGADSAGQPLTGTSLVWMSRGRVLGTGESFQATLSIGAHRVQLLGFGDDGTVGKASILVRVRHEAARK